MRRIIQATVYLPDDPPQQWRVGANCTAIHQVTNEAKIVIERQGQTDIVYIGFQCILESE